MNKAKIIEELLNMVAARLFSGQPWLADRETFSAYYPKLIEMGLLEQVRDEPLSWRITPLGRELDVDLFQVFMGIICEWDVSMASSPSQSSTPSPNPRPKPMRKHFWRRRSTYGDLKSTILFDYGF
jgi:hypothetical protein